MKRGLTAAQRASFFGSWWPACCEVQGWDDKSEKLRRDFVLEATTALYREAPGSPRPTERLSLCTQGQLTAVFKLTWFKTNPNSLDAALPVANPAEEQEADERRRAVVALSAKGLMTEEIARIAAPLCRKHGIGDWQRLPSKVLKEMMHWKQFQPAEIARRRAVNSIPLATIGDAPVTYYLRPPPKTPKPAVAGPY